MVSLVVFGNAITQVNHFNLLADRSPAQQVRHLAIGLYRLAVKARNDVTTDQARPVGGATCGLHDVERHSLVRSVKVIDAKI